MPLERDDRPWGYWETLHADSECKVKRIVVRPGARLSYQKHASREEHWTIVSGSSLVTINGLEKPFSGGDVVHIPLGAAHRIENCGSSDLIFIEVQRGTYFGEDDITRLADDYGRA